MLMLETLDSYVTATYPDLRKCIGSIQDGSNSGKLKIASSENKMIDDYKVAAVGLFKAGKIKDARKLICSQIRSEEIEDFFRWSYDNLGLWGDTSEQQDQAILVIRDAIVNHSMIADAEINLAAMLVELCNIRKEF